MREIRFKVKELDCQECAISIKRLLSSIEGVREVSFKYSTQEVIVNVNKNLTKEKIIKFLKRKGYSVVETSENFNEIYNTILFSFVGIIATILLVEILLEKLEVWNFPFKIPSEVLIFAVIVGGFNIFKSAFRGLLAKQINADLLMTIATLAALTLKEFVASLIIVFFMNIAHFIEKFTFENSRKAIKELVEQSPKDAIVIRNGKEVEVSIDKIKAGDIILVKPGSRIPVDGKIIFGSSYVNQAPITGEPIPVEKKVGDKVFAGSINQHGILHIKAERIGEETTLGKIIKLIEEIEVSKAPIQKFADKYSTYYLPAVLLASLATYLITKNPFASIAVLVVACPCAIALATPVAVVAAAGSLARKGIIVKGGLYLEYLAKVDTLVMDKTGTLTYGKPVVTNIVPFNSTELDVLRYAASIERYSEHPIALAILEKAKEKKAQLLKPKSFYYHVGKGISGKVRNSIIAIGNEKLMEYLKVRIPSKISRIKKEFEKMGKTALYVSKDYKIIGVIAISDLIRKEVFSTLKEVEKLGIKRIVLLTGDNEERAKAVANYLHVTEYKANLLPQEKVEYVKKLQSEGRRVLMIGDGVNDAPALMQADVGIAMGSGTDVAIDTSQVILMKDDLSKIPTAIRTARKAFRIIKQNIVFGIIFNISGILLASIGILTPILAAAAQSLPDVVVFLNSSRLLKF
jgi:Cd2+/Zn2+-exporting ATPase/Cu+-exporting ATPase